MNKEQIKHWTSVLSDLATAQFLFLGGKNLYLYTKTMEFDPLILAISGLIYLMIHLIIHLILADLEG